jgi:hypothetical protein
MNMPKKPKGKPRGKPFVCGSDPRRHPVTRTDCRKGYLIAARLAKMPSRVRCWLRKKITRYYHERPRRKAVPA